jgi:hypothetical protein
MAKWDFKIVGASFVKELIPIDGDVEFRSQSFMQPSFDLEGDKIVMKESGNYKSAILFPQIGEIDGVVPTDLEDAYAKLLILVENFNQGGGSPGTTPKIFTALLSQTGESDKQTLSSGAVTKGVSYKIDGASDGDFSNVGAPNNDDLTSFIATINGVPNSYGTAELTYDLGAPVAIVLENTIGNIWFEYRLVGIYRAWSDNLFIEDKTAINIDAFSYINIANYPAIANETLFSENNFDISTTLSGSPNDDLLVKNRLEIKVYN